MDEGLDQACLMSLLQLSGMARPHDVFAQASCGVYAMPSRQRLERFRDNELPHCAFDRAPKLQDERATRHGWIRSNHSAEHSSMGGATYDVHVVFCARGLRLRVLSVHEDQLILDCAESRSLRGCSREPESQPNLKVDSAS